MSPFNTAESALDSLSSRFSDLQQPLRQPCPGEGATVTTIDERNAARAITASRLADWAYSAKAVAQAQADADGALMRAPSPADLEALGLQCELTNGSPSALAAYQSAGQERLAAKKAHTAATSQTAWPDSVTAADMPAAPTAPDPTSDKKSGRGKPSQIGDGDGFKDEGEGDDRPVGDGFGGEGVDDDSAPDADDTATPATNSSVDSNASRPLPLDTPAPVSAEAAGTSLSADTSDPTGARTGTLSNTTSPAGSPTAQQPPQMAPIQPNASVTGPRGGASPQLGQPQNGSRQAPTGPRPAQTGKDDTPPPSRDTTFDPLIAGTGGAALGIAGGAHTASGAPTGPSTPSVPTAPSGATGVPTGPAPAHGATTPPPAPAPPPQGMGAGSTLRPPVAPSSSGETVHAATTRTPIYQADVDPSLDPLTADPSDLDWTPPTIPTEEKK